MHGACTEYCSLINHKIWWCGYSGRKREELLGKTRLSNGPVQWLPKPSLAPAKQATALLQEISALCPNRGQRCCTYKFCYSACGTCPSALEIISFSRRGISAYMTQQRTTLPRARYPHGCRRTCIRCVEAQKPYRARISRGSLKDW